jgi:hypothetical protein
MNRWQGVRTLVLFAGGLGIAYHEVYLAPQPRELAMIMAAYMLGLPVFGGLDDKRNDKRNGKR